MNIIGFRAFADFTRLYRDAESPLNAWLNIASKADWKNIVEVKQTYPHADAVGACTIFNIKGNRYRLVVII